MYVFIHLVMYASIYYFIYPLTQLYIHSLLVVSKSIASELRDILDRDRVMVDPGISKSNVSEYCVQFNIL